MCKCGYVIGGDTRRTPVEKIDGFMSMTMALPCAARCCRSRSPPSARATLLEILSTLADKGSSPRLGAVAAAEHDRPKTSRSKASNRLRSKILSASWGMAKRRHAGRVPASGDAQHVKLYQNQKAGTQKFADQFILYRSSYSRASEEVA